MLSRQTMALLREMVDNRETTEANANDNNPPILQQLRQAQRELADAEQGEWQRAPLPRESHYAREIDAHLATVIMLYRKAGWRGEFALCRLMPQEQLNAATPASVEMADGDGLPKYASLPASEMVLLRNAAIRYFYNRVIRKEAYSRRKRLYVGKSYASLQTAMKQVLDQMHIDINEKDDDPLAPAQGE